MENFPRKILSKTFFVFFPYHTQLKDSWFLSDLNWTDWNQKLINFWSVFLPPFFIFYIKKTNSKVILFSSFSISQTNIRTKSKSRENEREWKSHISFLALQWHFFLCPPPVKKNPIILHLNVKKFLVQLIQRIDRSFVFFFHSSSFFLVHFKLRVLEIQFRDKQQKIKFSKVRPILRRFSAWKKWMNEWMRKKHRKQNGEKK